MLGIEKADNRSPMALTEQGGKVDEAATRKTVGAAQG